MATPKNYLPLYSPAELVTFTATSAVEAGQVVQVGTADMSVAPAAAGSTSVVGIAGHDANQGDKVTVEVGKTIHELKATGAVTRGGNLKVAANGAVTAAGSDPAVFRALTSAVDGALVRVIQL